MIFKENKYNVLFLFYIFKKEKNETDMRAWWKNLNI